MVPAFERRREGDADVEVVQDEAERAEFAEVLDEIVRDGARRMLAAALESEVEA